MTAYIPDSMLPDCPYCRNTRALVVGDYAVQCRCVTRGTPLLRFLDTTIGKMYTTASLDVLTPMDDDQATMLGYAERFIKWWSKGQKGLYLWSAQTGNGKSLIASAILNKIGLPSQAIEASVLWDAMRSTYESEESLKRYFNAIAYVPALLLDDLGMSNTEKTDEWLTDILNARIERGALTIITSNLHPSELKKASPRAISRLMAHCHPINTKSGTDWRVRLSEKMK